MHLCDCALSLVHLFEENVCDATVDAERRVHGHSDIFDDAIFAEYFADVIFFDVPR